MVNEVRTSLLNLPAWTGPGAPAGEEYVPVTYVPKRLTGTLAAARAALFGPGADRTGMNFTLARLLAYLHASPLWSEVTRNDARVSYAVTVGPYAFGSLGPVVAPATVGWSGTAEFAFLGRAFGSWTVTTDGAGGYETSGSDGVSTVGAVSVTDLGDAVPLPGTQLSLVVPSGAAGVWDVTLTVPPRYHFVALADLPDASELFRPVGTAADQIHYAAWAGDGPPLLRAAAAALALSARTLELA